MRGHGRTWLLLVLGLLPGVARSQGTSPLRKAELVQMLATGALSKRDIAALVQRNCVTFQPSERDRGELRAAGADDAVLAAVDQCVRARARRPPAPIVPTGPTAPTAPVATPPPPPPPPQPPSGVAALRVITTETLAAAAGTEATVVVQLLRGTAPQRGVELRLHGASIIPGGGLAQDPTAVTNGRGVATFQVPAGTTAGTYRLSVALASGTAMRPGSGDQINLVTTPAPVAGAQADPAVVTRGDFTVSVVDRYGNHIAGVPLELRPVTAELAGALYLQGTTDERGQAVFTLAPGSVRRAGEVAVLTRGARIGAFGVRRAPQVLSDVGTQFTRGAERHGTVGAPLGEPLVLEVRDTSGAPIVGQAVTFAATNGEVAPTSAESDSGGVARVRVTLGTHAGPVIVTAKVGSLARTATVSADPGPASQLVVERDGAPVAGVVTVRSRDTVVLRVRARDAHGNEAALGDFTATTTGSAIALRSANATGSQAIVTLEAQRNGAGEVQIAAAGFHARVAVDVSVPAGLSGLWAVGMRAAWLGVNRPWVALANVQGVSGTAVALVGRRTLRGGFSLALGAEVGSVSIDTSGGSTSATLLEGSARFELAVLPRRVITPVLSLGGGGYRVKSGDNGRAIYHTNVFWAGGVGLDAALSSTVTAEVRAERQWLTDRPAGHVGTLWPVGAGLRVSL